MATHISPGIDLHKKKKHLLFLSSAMLPVSILQILSSCREVPLYSQFAEKYLSGTCDMVSKIMKTVKFIIWFRLLT